ncbi:hypothetical protein FPSE_01942 [Fusarium pseudograminearum CS3096]|uniref:Uncharacterized protein n=1 Tax=Fusarium pseudograminearum (strain CS3096) TaxID=1028729 RepID=K3VRP3_FUSPC|nr:hypothetical protein FPSE_01942 [Fusarium pseudograminearum CS3096]EKJ77849.1 hypothetical protein FPSE_01942 [Fusarium pseudograminearum CS3096]
MKSFRTHRSKSLPSTKTTKKSLFSKISRRLSLSTRRRTDSVRLYDDSDDDTIQVIPQELQQPPPQSRFARRASRFWSVSSANQFEEDCSSPQSPAYPSYGGAYVPRHAASDFSKTATNRLTMMPEADETTLCSYNYRTDTATRSFSMTDSEPDVDHREQALRDLTATRSSTLSSQTSNDYTFFSVDATASVDARHRRSAAAWAELEQRSAAVNYRMSCTDHLIPRQGRTHSTYLGLPGSSYDSSRPASSVAPSLRCEMTGIIGQALKAGVLCNIGVQIWLGIQEHEAWTASNHNKRNSADT